MESTEEWIKGTRLGKEGSVLSQHQLGTETSSTDWSFYKCLGNLVVREDQITEGPYAQLEFDAPCEGSKTSWLGLSKKGSVLPLEKKIMLFPWAEWNGGKAVIKPRHGRHCLRREVGVGAIWLFSVSSAVSSNTRVRKDPFLTTWEWLVL